MLKFPRTAAAIIAGACLVTPLVMTSPQVRADDPPSFSDPAKLKAWNDYVDSVNLGVNAMNAKKYKEAIPHLERAIAQGEAHFSNTAWLAAAYGHLGSTYARMKEYQKGIKPYNNALKIYTELGQHTESIRTTKMLGYLFAQTKDYKNSLASYQTIVLMAELGMEFPRDVKFSAVMRDMATVYQLSGKPENAQKTYESALPVLLKNSPNDPVTKQIAVQLADIKFDQKKYEEALKLYEIIAKDMKPDSFTLAEVKALHQTGRIYLILENFKEAKPRLETAVLGLEVYKDKALKDYGIAQVDMGVLLFKTQKFDACIKPLTKGAEILKQTDPKSAPMFDALNLLIEANYKIKKPEEAKRWAKELTALGGSPGQIVTKDPRVLQATKLAQEALNLHQDGSSDAAEKKYKKAIALFDEAGQGGMLYARLNNNLGRLYLEENKPKAAVPYLEKAAKISEERGKMSKQYAEILTGLAQAFVGTKQNKRAINTFKQAIQIVEDIDGKDAKSLIWIYDSYADALIRAKRKTQAKQYEKKSKALRKKHNVPADVKFFGLEG